MDHSNDLGPQPANYPDRYRPQINESVNLPHQTATPRHILYSTPEISGHRQNHPQSNNPAFHGPPRHHHYTRQRGARGFQGRVDEARDDWAGEGRTREDRAREDRARDGVVKTLTGSQNTFFTPRTNINTYHDPGSGQQEDRHSPHPPARHAEVQYNQLRPNERWKVHDARNSDVFQNNSSHPSAPQSLRHPPSDPRPSNTQLAPRPLRLPPSGPRFPNIRPAKLTPPNPLNPRFPFKYPPDGVVPLSSLSAKPLHSDPMLIWDDADDQNPRRVTESWANLQFKLMKCRPSNTVNRPKNSKYIVLFCESRGAVLKDSAWLSFKLFPEEGLTFIRSEEGNEKNLVILRANTIPMESHKPEDLSLANSLIKPLATSLREAGGDLELVLGLRGGSTARHIRSWFRKISLRSSLHSAPNPSTSTASTAPSTPRNSVSTNSPDLFKANGTEKELQEGPPRGTNRLQTEPSVPEQDIPAASIETESPAESASETSTESEAHISRIEVEGKKKSEVTPPEYESKIPVVDSDSEPPKEPLRKKGRVRTRIKQEPESDREGNTEGRQRKRAKKKKRKQIPVADSDTDVPEEPRRKRRKRLKTMEQAVVENGASDVERPQRKKKKSKSAPSEPPERETPIVDSNSDNLDEALPKKKKRPRLSEPERAASKSRGKKTGKAKAGPISHPPLPPSEDLIALQKRLAEINNAKNELFVEEQELKAKLLRQKFDQSKQGSESDGKPLTHCTCSACGEYGHRKDSWKCPKHPGRNRVLG